ncbi:MAG: hypothetical protein RLY66_622 [Candidatus Parcubacteria bacterium]|jgi:cell division ATPase FtsA
MFFSRTNGTLTLILDVQSSIVRGTLIHMHPEGKPRVIFTHNVGISYKPHARSGYLVKAALAAIEEIVGESLRFISQIHSIKDPRHNLPRNISTVHYVLASPWVVSQAKTVTQSFKKETPVTKAYILKLIGEERAKMSGKDEHDIRVIEEKIFDVRLNGYSVASWESRTTTQLEISFVSSLAGGRMIERFIQACDRAVGKRSVMFHSSLFLQHLAIEKVVPDRASYALVHIHGELTDVAIMHAHSCIFFGSYPFGAHTIVRTIARELKISEQTADSTLNLISQGALDATRVKKQTVIVENMSNGWIGEFRKLLKMNPSASGIPHHVIISARAHEDFFMESFKKAYPQSTLEVLDFESIRKLVDYENSVEKLRLTGLYIIAIHSMEK